MLSLTNDNGWFSIRDRIGPLDREDIVNNTGGFVDGPTCLAWAEALEATPDPNLAAGDIPTTVLRRRTTVGRDRR